MMCFNHRWLTLIPIVLLVCLFQSGFSQHLYTSYWDDQVEFGTRGAIYEFDTTTCTMKNVFSPDNDFGIFINDLAFHPNGRIFATTSKGMLEIDPVQWQLINFIPWSVLKAPSVFTKIIFDEEGVALISRDEEVVGNTSSEAHLYRFDVRNESILWDKLYTREEFDGQILLSARLGSNYVNLGLTAQTPYVLDLEKLQYDTIGHWPMNDGQTFLISPSVAYPYCADYPALISRAIIPGVDANPTGLVKFVPATGKLNTICDGELGLPFNGPLTTTTDFRSSPLRIDLDGNNSSGHITEGYYDVLTTCRREAPLMKDVVLHTCASGSFGEIDSISFRLKYYDQPRLPQERIYSIEFPEQIVRTSPDRYVWHNPHGNDELRIKEYLNSLLYQADWVDSGLGERVVMTTMHVGGDSTTSWSIFQLANDGIFAGRDSVVNYCPGSGTIDLLDYLSSEVLEDGRIEPSLSGGGSIFTPGTDEDGAYLYILEKENCADTAIITIRSLEQLGTTAIDTVILCSGNGRFIGFPPGQFEAVEWWDGSTGDSVWISNDADIDFFAVVQQEDCGLRIPITVVEEDVQGIAGQDSMIRYCGSGSINLTTTLGLSSAYQYSTTPELTEVDGSILFDPGEDQDGTYLLYASNGSCLDTARIILEESETGILMLDPVRRCVGEEVKIGLPSDSFDIVTWWNGDIGDSAVVQTGETGPYVVEAVKEGCVYAGEFMVQDVPEVVFPDAFRESWMICEGSPERLIVDGLDSIVYDNRVYYPEEEIEIATGGELELRGYQAGCSVVHHMSVVLESDPASGYSQIVLWCESEELPLTLPDDEMRRQFRWADGTALRERRVDSTGVFGVVIESGDCTFEAAYEVVESSDCADNCDLSIPNAVSPNGDGINEDLPLFAPRCRAIRSARLLSKWGNVLYQTENAMESTSLLIPAEVWQPLTPGVYILAVDYENRNGSVKSKWQEVLVVR